MRGKFITFDLRLEKADDIIHISDSPKTQFLDLTIKVEENHAGKIRAQGHSLPDSPAFNDARSSDYFAPVRIEPVLDFRVDKCQNRRV